jgi:hypothetical protein
MMVTKATKKKGSKVKVGKLRLNKETVKDLTNSEAKLIKGGQVPNVSGNGHCHTSVYPRCG